MSNSVTNHNYKEMVHSIVVPESLSDEEKRKRYQPLLNYLNTSTPNKLYRFRSCKERAFHEFDQDILGFAPASEMNDDFDGMLYFDKERIKAGLMNTVTPENIVKIVDLFSHGHIPAEIKNNLPESLIVHSIDTFRHVALNELRSFTDGFIAFATNGYEKRIAFLRHLTQDQKIACLSKSINSAAMWGYYGNNGTGFALSYDLRGNIFDKYCISPVIYGKERFDATEFATWLLQQLLLQQILDPRVKELYPNFRHIIPCPDQFMPTKVMIHKSNRWRHEQEWRLVFYEKDGQNEKYPNVKEKPTAIYLGRNISAINEKILRNIAAEKGIPVYKMTVQEDSPTYNLFPQRVNS